MKQKSAKNSLTSMKNEKILWIEQRQIHVK